MAIDKHNDAEALDHTPLTFGKYQGKTPNEISEMDSSYLVWAYENVTNRPICSQLLYASCKEAKEEGNSQDDSWGFDQRDYLND